MKPKNENKKTNGIHFNSFRGTIVVTILIALLFCVAIYLMYLSDFFSFVNLNKLFSDDSESNVANNRGEMFEYLEIEKDTPEYEYLYEITPTELLSALSEYTMPESYGITAEIVNYSGTSGKMQRVVAVYNGGKYEIEKFLNGILSETIACDGSKITVKDEKRNRFSEYTVSDNFSFESQCNMPSLEAITDICALMSGENMPENIDKLDVSLVSSSGETLYCVKIIYKDYAQTEEYYISAERKLIVNLYTYISDRLVYRYSVSEFNVM